jgi:hypothetical protein
MSYQAAPMEPGIENNALARAKADLADFDRKIALATAEEERIAAERQRWETERGKVQSFIEMYQRYAGNASSASGAGSVDIRDHSESSKPNGSGWASESTHVANSATSRNSRKRRPPIHRKPPGTPTTHEMILAALRDAEGRGLPGLAPKDIGAFIRQQWWPHLKGSSIGPAAWRMYKDKEIRREGEVYAPLAS